MSARRRLPQRRRCESFEFTCGGLHYHCSYSRFADGSLAELFLQNSKPGSQSDVNSRDAAVAASLCLQWGVPVEVLRKALLRDPRGKASSPLGAVLDLIAEGEKC